MTAHERKEWQEMPIDGRLTRHQRYALDERDKMIDRDGYNCWRCGIYLPEARGGRAHRIARTIPNLCEHGPYVLDHHLNLRHSCDSCNSYAMPFEDAVQREEMLAAIIADLKAQGLPTSGEDFQDRRRAAKKAKDEKIAAEKAEEKKRALEIRNKKAKEEYKKKTHRKIEMEKIRQLFRVKRVMVDDYAAYRKAYLRLRDKMKWLSKKYNVDMSEVCNACPPADLRKIEQLREDVAELKEKSDALPSTHELIRKKD